MSRFAARIGSSSVIAHVLDDGALDRVVVMKVRAKQSVTRADDLVRPQVHDQKISL
jgi:hypothetical protein